MQDAQIQPARANLLLREDTMLGICEALGRDFGFHPNWLRVALACGLLWNPLAVVGTYLGLGAIVLVSRLLFPAPRAAAPVEPAREVPKSEVPAAPAAPALGTEAAEEAQREPELVAA